MTITSETCGVSSTTQKSPANRKRGWRTKYTMATKTTRKTRNSSFEKIPPRWPAFSLKTRTPIPSLGWVNLAQAFCRVFRQRSVKVDFLNAVGLTSLLHDGKYFDMPMVIAGDRAPILAQFSLGLQRVGGCVQNHVIA